jgi:hypothetical protein
MMMMMMMMIFYFKFSSRFMAYALRPLLLINAKSNKKYGEEKIVRFCCEDFELFVS